MSTTCSRVQMRTGNLNRDLKQAGRQRDDGGQNRLVKISYCKESLSFIIHRMKSI